MAKQGERGELLSASAFIVFPEETLDKGSVWRVAPGIVYADMGGVRILLDTDTSDPEADVWYVLLEDGKPVLIDSD